MKIVFSKFGREELEDATRFYEREQPGLGGRFRQEVRQAVARIVAYPQGWSIERGEIRKCLLHRFPYKLLYSVEADHILVIAVAHQHRRPDYRIDRESGDPTS